MHGLRDDRAALSRIVRDADPDVVCVQEAPKYLRWRTKCAALARGLRPALRRPAAVRREGRRCWPACASTSRDATEQCLSRQWLWPARGVAAAAVAKGGARLTVASSPPAAAAGASGWRTRCGCCRSGHRSAATHALVAGDINERPGHAAWQALARRRAARPGAGLGADVPGVRARPSGSTACSATSAAGRALLRGARRAGCRTGQRPPADPGVRRASPPPDTGTSASAGGGWRGSVRLYPPEPRQPRGVGCPVVRLAGQRPVVPAGAPPAPRSCRRAQAATCDVQVKVGWAAARSRSRWRTSRAGSQPRESRASAVSRTASAM